MHNINGTGQGKIDVKTNNGGTQSGQVSTSCFPREDNGKPKFFSVLVQAVAIEICNSPPAYILKRKFAAMGTLNLSNFQF